MVAFCARPCPSGTHVLFLRYVSDFPCLLSFEILSICASSSRGNGQNPLLSMHLDINILHRFAWPLPYKAIKALVKWQWLTTTLWSTEGLFCSPVLKEFPSGFLHPLINPQLLAPIDPCVIVSWTWYRPCCCSRFVLTHRQGVPPPPLNPDISCRGLDCIGVSKPPLVLLADLWKRQESIVL